MGDYLNTSAEKTEEMQSSCSGALGTLALPLSPDIRKVPTSLSDSQCHRAGNVTLMSKLCEDRHLH